MNVLWITSDQYAFFASGCYGSPTVHTPNLDGLAETACRFDRACTASPVCIPARDVLLTGRYAHTWGYPETFCVPVDVPTAANIFKQNGYVTAHIGKMHPHIPYTRGFDFLVDYGHYYDYLGPKTERFTRQMGALDSGSGSPWMGPDWYEAEPWGSTDPAAAWPSNPPIEQVLAEEDHFEAFVARLCDRFLSDHSDRPFFLQAAFCKPHAPFAVPAGWDTRYRAEDMVLPNSFFDAGIIPAHPSLSKWKVKNPEDPAVQQRAKQMMADYYAAVTYMDDCLGRILASLKRLGLQDNTLVVYTSDHGECLFHHGTVYKFNFLEESVRVPLLLRVPGLTAGGMTSAALTDSTDLLPTCLDLAGIRHEEWMSGVSLAPVLRGETDAVRTHCFSEAHGRSMVRSNQWKLAHYYGEWFLTSPELHPGESRNLYPELQNRLEIQKLQKELLSFENNRRAGQTA